MNKTLLKALTAIARPFIGKKLDELQEVNPKKGKSRPHPAQTSTQVAKVGIGATLVTLTQVESVEATVTAIAVLIINLFFLYKPEKK